MAKKTTSKQRVDFSAQSAEDVRATLAEYRAQLATMTLSLTARQPSEKRALRRNIARALTALRTK